MKHLLYALAILIVILLIANYKNTTTEVPKRIEAIESFINPKEHNELVEIVLTNSEHEKQELKRKEVLPRIAVGRIEVNSQVKEIAKAKIDAKWGDNQWPAFNEVVNRESGWKVGIKNSSSGACGLGQALPCSKLGDAYGSVNGELDWMINYIAGRYDTPSKALAFHDSHGWY